MTTNHSEEYRIGPLRAFLYCLIICAVGAAAYYNALGGEFVYDDNFSLLWQPAVKTLDPSTLWHAFGVRFLAYLTFALNYRFGGFDPFWFHLVNISIHLINSCLVFWLARLVIQRACDLDASRLGDRYADAAALTAALIFVAHPIETQAVTFIVQRLASMMALFYLLSIILFFKGRICMEEGRKCGVVLIALSVLSALAAMFTKQNSFTLPLSLLLVELAFFSPSWRLMKRKVAIFAIFASLLVVLPIVIILYQGVSLQEIGDATRATKMLGRYDFFATQINVVRTYLRLMIFPAAQRVDYSYPIFHSILNERTILSAILHGLIITAAIASFRKNRAVFFGIALFYITLLVEASIFPIQDVIVEHRLYLPSVGFIMAAAYLMWLASRRVHLNARSMWIFVGILVAVLAVLTHQRNKAWADSETLWKDNVLKDANSWRAHYNLGKSYELQRRWAEARSEWEESTKIADSAWAWNNIGNILTRQEKYEEAMKAFKKSTELDPSYAMPYGNMGIAMEKLGKYDEAMRFNEKAISINPEFAPPYFNLGRLYLLMRDFETSEQLFRKAISLDPNHADAILHLAVVLNKTGRPEEAMRQLEVLLKIRPDDEGARDLMRRIRSGYAGDE